MDDTYPFTATVVGSGTNVSTKRPRSTTPQPNNPKRGSLDFGGYNNNNNSTNEMNVLQQPSSQPTGVDRDDIRAMNIRSTDRTVRYTELNELLQLSSNYDVNYSMRSDAIIKALCDVIIDDCLQWKSSSDDDDNEEDHKRDHQMVVLRSVDAWTNPPTSYMRLWAKYCCSDGVGNMSKESYKVCENISMILRNFSFTGANTRLLAYSPQVIHVLIAFLYISVHQRKSTVAAANSTNTLEPTIPLSALQVLRHLVPCLDVTGQQLLTDKLFYDGRSMAYNNDGPAVPNANEFGKCLSNEWGGFGAPWLAKKLDSKEDTVENIPTQFLLDLTGDYLVSIWSIFPAIKEIIVHPNTCRSVILAGLDFMQELINVARVGIVGAVVEEDPDIQPGQEYEIPNLRSVLVNLPDSMLNRLVSLLNVPRAGPDSIDYVDPIEHPGQRNNPSKLLAGYNTSVDFECRDRALDVLVPLLELDSPRMAIRLGQKSSKGDPAKKLARVELYDALIPILTTSVGRNDAPLLATQLLRELAKASEENNTGFLYIKGRLLEIASRDARVSQLFWNDLFPRTYYYYDDENISNENEA